MVRCAASKFALCQLAQPKLATRALLACFRTRLRDKIAAVRIDTRTGGSTPRPDWTPEEARLLLSMQDRALSLASVGRRPEPELPGLTPRTRPSPHSARAREGRTGRRGQLAALPVHEGGPVRRCRADVASRQDFIDPHTFDVADGGMPPGSGARPRGRIAGRASAVAPVRVADRSPGGRGHRVGASSGPYARRGAEAAAGRLVAGRDVAAGTVRRTSGARRRRAPGALPAGSMPPVVVDGGVRMIVPPRQVRSEVGRRGWVSSRVADFPIGRTNIFHLDDMKATFRR